MKTLDDEKYEGGNRIQAYFLGRFIDRVRGWLAANPAPLILDIGCGEGHLARRLAYRGTVVHADLSHDALLRARDVLRAGAHRAAYVRADITALPFRRSLRANATCLEVLEHLEHPERALAEIARTVDGEVLISVPREPFFSLGSLFSGRYLSRLGRHPGHVQFWTETAAARLIEGRLKIRLSLSTPFWSVFSCRR